MTVKVDVQLILNIFVQKELLKIYGTKNESSYTSSI